MKCFSSCMSTRKRLALEEKERLFEPCSPISSGSPDGLQNSSSSSFESERQHLSSEDKRKMAGRSSAQSFEYRELAVATKNFKDSNLIGEGGFGKVYKGYLNGQVVAVKKLALDGLQGNQEFLVEVLMLSLLHHPNLVTLIGYCAEEDQRLLVYEYMPKGSLSDHLYSKRPFLAMQHKTNVAYEEDVLDWSKRLKIAAGAARGIQHLHMVANPPVIYRDLKSANILLDENFSPKLSDFGLAKLGPTDDKTHVSTRVMGTYGYCAPEYASSGKLSSKSDIYSFGVVLLELVTGKKALDLTKSNREQSLVMWARPFIKDRRRYMELLDPRLKGRVPTHSARHFIAVAGMCLKEDAGGRPTIDEIVKALDYLASEAQSPRSATGPRTSTALSSAGSTPTDSTATNSSPFSVRGSHFSRKFK